ncbi:MAG: amidohydrolase family protein, partial [Gemmatimonadetes bacterium]|nr:amidohydrolase family protein [Gemmatimonadota bacterium]NIT88230.1 amidohydrolase family protein [Gemmatimonadota bacterium]NIU32038.1 amidohydrolase family protein [Gemmatimonadota bacterium]NIU36647.1 amidohydrolase family protein [Gemmatimonadota bacterium]NIV62409.1 amidohydrolase family protein [Gemmatimonadota bacterium]
RVYPSDPDVVGKTLDELARERDSEPVDVALDLLEVGGAFFASFNQNPADKKRFMRQAWTMTGSDGELVPSTEDPHPRSYANVQHKIRKYVVEEEAVDLAFAVRSMTALPAAVFSLEDRGVLRSGAFADVVVFDLERMRDHATFEDPHQLSEGVIHLLVNGGVAIEDERVTGTRAGRVLSLREGRAAPASSN